MIAVVDYGAGNIMSVQNALNYIGIESMLTDEKEVISKADGIILPGVGAFSHAAAALSDKGLWNSLKETAISGKPLLGICLGMQLLFDESFEFGKTKGLSLIKGSVNKIVNPGEKIPHMGWNSLEILNDNKIIEGIKEGDHVYFVHSYKAETEEKYINAFSRYGDIIPAVVSNGNVYGAQFHPEKSGDVGLKILKNFGDIVNDNITCN